MLNYNYGISLRTAERQMAIQSGYLDFPALSIDYEGQRRNWIDYHHINTQSQIDHMAWSTIRIGIQIQVSMHILQSMELLYSSRLAPGTAVDIRVIPAIR